MLKTKKPSAIIYGLEEKGTLTLISDIYFEENLQEPVVLNRVNYLRKYLENYCWFLQGNHLILLYLRRII